MASSLGAINRSGYEERITCSIPEVTTPVNKRAQKNEKCVFSVNVSVRLAQVFYFYFFTDTTDEFLLMNF